MLDSYTNKYNTITTMIQCKKDARLFNWAKKSWEIVFELS